MSKRELAAVVLLDINMTAAGILRDQFGISHTDNVE